MEMMKAFARYCFLLTILIFLVMAHCSSKSAKGAVAFDKLPSGWSVTTTNSATADQLVQFSEKLGCQFSEITDYNIRTGNALLKMNVATLSSRGEAANAYDVFLRLHHNDNTYVKTLTQTQVIEFSGNQAMVTKLRYFLFGDYGDVSTWDVQLKISLVKSLDPAQRNRFF